MPILSGTRLGPYEVIAPLGAGGMGEVYRARDTRLDRSVAIKVLPVEFAENAQFKIRFEREAKTISQLNHPHICTLYDVGENYLVMELLEGETVAARVAKGPLPVEQVLRYGIEIAEALEKAHKAGVVHRDLKPGNVMITKSGAKLLDFGLAKEAECSVGALTSLRTERKNLTEEGTIIGTFQYMAPEQIEAQPVDARTDIFALGAVLYEMATGRRAFEGKSKASLIASILTAEPQPICALQPLTPAAFDRMVHTCLQKDPDARFQNAHDISLELKWIAEASANAQSEIVGRGLNWILLASSIIVAALAAGAVVYRHFQNPRRPIIQTAINLPKGAHFDFDQGPMALSPDGTRVAFAATQDGKTLLWVRPLDASTAQPLAGTDGASYPFWSPDSRLIAFFADAKLKTMDPSGGTPQVLADAPSGRGGTWNRDGVILFVPSTGDAIMRVNASGGVVTAATRLDEKRGEFSHRWPRFLPDGRRFLYLAFAGSVAGTPKTAGGRICIGSLGSSEPLKFVVTANSNVAYMNAGYLLYTREGSLVAQKFDLDSGTVSGNPEPVVEQIQYNKAAGVATFSETDDGLLCFLNGGARKSQLTWVDRTGKVTGTIGPIANLWDPRLSHDGKRLAVSVDDAHDAGDIWIYDIARPLETHFTFDPADDLAPVWANDDSSLIFSSYRGPADIFRKPTAGSGGDERIVASPLRKMMSDASPDGKTILCSEQSPRTHWDLIAYSLADGKATPFAATGSNEIAGQFSPDGHWVAYVSDESGRQEVYVARFPASSGKWQVSSGGGIMPRWSHKGNEIFYCTPQGGTLMAASIHLGESAEVELPRKLFTVRVNSFVGIVRTQYDVAPDDQHFLVNVTSDEQAQTPITLYQNWLAKVAH